MRKDEPTVDVKGQALPSTIEGVDVRRLLTHADHRGALTNFLNARDPFWSEPVIYAYHFSIAPGRIKGWGMHRLQTDRYFVVSGSVRVVLYDGENFSEIYFTDTTPGLVKIPPGVWHADQNFGQMPAHVINFPTVAYNPTDPDKYRIPPHSSEIDFDWTLRDG